MGQTIVSGNKSLLGAIIKIMQYYIYIYIGMYESSPKSQTNVIEKKL